MNNILEEQCITEYNEVEFYKRKFASLCWEGAFWSCCLAPEINRGCLYRAKNHEA